MTPLITFLGFNPLEGVIQLSDFMNNIYNLCSKDEPKSYWIGTT